MVHSKFSDELNFLLNEDYSGGISEYEKELANRCMSRRADLAALLCNNPQKSIVRVLLRAARYVLRYSLVFCSIFSINPPKVRCGYANRVDKIWQLHRRLHWKYRETFSGVEGMQFDFRTS